MIRAQKQRQNDVYELARQKYTESEEALNEKKENDSFYQKLADGFPVSVRIVGDSIGAGAGAEPAENGWANLLRGELRRQYNVSVSITNISMGGNTSYAGYVRTISLPDDADFDLAILCYGQNDEIDHFSLYYESVVRAIKSRFPKCDLMSILESSQRSYTEKIQPIQQIAEHYEYPIVDTIEPFAENFDALTTIDGIHPNNDGHTVYFEKVLEQIKTGVAEYRGQDLETVLPINPGVTAFDTYRYISADEFERVDDLTYQVPVKITGIMGIDYDPRQSADKSADVFIDGKLDYTLKYDFGQRHIVMITDHCEVNDIIRITFAEKATADRFYGLCFSNIE